jgi:ribosomal-protein-alanine N-acetyltransferase
MSLNTHLNFRPMQLSDLPIVMAIERKCYPFPWTENIFKSCLKAGNLAVVVEVSGEIIGYALFSIVLDEASLLNICIKSSYQGQGYAYASLQLLCEHLRKIGIHILFLEVRPSNHRALNLYHQFGFNQIGVRKNYYPAPHGREDAWMFALTL